MSLKDKLIPEKLPRHVAVIMDGNGRWAKKKGNQRIFGHRNGVKAVRETVEAAAEMKIDYLTLYAFSTENWNRPKIEVNALMSLLVSSIHNEISTLNKNNIRLLAVGDLEKLPSKVRKELNWAIEQTSVNNGLSLVLALSYSGRWEIINAVNQILNDVKNGKIDIGEIDYSVFNSYLVTAKIPDPELLIRTSGEYRISNFLLWQIAYTELYFTEVLWPDFRKEEFYKALYDFQNRERRFGKISEQL
ncbi:MAG: di-trans,poly-cis-decaprenylcistransferase [Bacteroidetes bacterium GWF2_38_335]|nr:MAG: di-trans,poly-cis-decaprenylcistransferase [Bacteroidetes bacterium GWF2_38_335]OFY80511.1 MAG: di-trans,poly-cis-decaprenylcistransferase [Bacteroidetes bacterium RIFOXYA12_FULL_38_20]HBS85879.1 isoprenyl transferase [Bacteroidales bacterium]